MKPATTKIGGAVAAISILLALLFGLSESRQIREMQQGEFCRHNLARIVFALMEYADQEGNGLRFPESLDKLIALRYLPNQEVLKCASHGTNYLYFSDLQRDMPETMPLVMEANPDHLYFDQSNRAIPFGIVAYVDGDIKLLNQSYLSFEQKQAANARDIMRTKDLAYLLQVTTNPNFALQAAAFWRLRQEHDILGISKLKNSWAALEKQYPPGTLTSFESKPAEAALRQLAYLLWQADTTMVWPRLKYDFAHNSYWIRKQAWQMVNRQATEKMNPLTAIMLQVPDQTQFTWLPK